MDIEFLFDETLEEQENQINLILKELDKPNKDVDIARTFLRGCLLAFRKQVKQVEIVKPRQIEIKKPLVVKPIPPKVVYQPVVSHQEIKPSVITKDLIFDKFSNKVLASVTIDEGYKIKQPETNDTDFKVFLKIKKKRPVDREKAWNLILKYAKKYGATGHETNIKYYVVNYLFGFGKVEPLLHDSDIRLIKCIGDSNIEVRVNGKDLRTNLKLTNDELRNFILEICGKLGIKITRINPVFNFSNIRGFKISAVVNWDDKKSELIFEKIN